MTPKNTLAGFRLVFPVTVQQLASQAVLPQIWRAESDDGACSIHAKIGIPSLDIDTAGCRRAGLRFPLNGGLLTCSPPDDDWMVSADMAGWELRLKAELSLTELLPQDVAVLPAVPVPLRGPLQSFSAAGFEIRYLFLDFKDAAAPDIAVLNSKRAFSGGIKEAKITQYLQLLIQALFKSFKSEHTPFILGFLVKGRNAPQISTVCRNYWLVTGGVLLPGNESENAGSDLDTMGPELSVGPGWQKNKAILGTVLGQIAAFLRNGPRPADFGGFQPEGTGRFRLDVPGKGNRVIYTATPFVYSKMMRIDLRDWG
jgi:hypothetical protein